MDSTSQRQSMRVKQTSILVHWLFCSSKQTTTEDSRDRPQSGKRCEYRQRHWCCFHQEGPSCEGLEQVLSWLLWSVSCNAVCVESKVSVVVQFLLLLLIIISDESGWSGQDDGSQRHVQYYGGIFEIQVAWPARRSADGLSCQVKWIFVRSDL